jgi:AraC-like DNA-binding protein
MIVGTLATISRARFLREGALYRLLPRPDTEQLLGDLAYNLCDIVVIPPPLDSGVTAEDFRGVCCSRPVSAVHCAEAAAERWIVIAAGSAAEAVLPAGAILETRLGLGSLRQVWVTSWVSRLAHLLFEAGRHPHADRIGARIFSAMLVAPSPRDLAVALATSTRSIERMLAKARLRGPKRFAAAAKVFRAWELARVGRWSLERIAYELAYSSLSSMDRSVRANTGLRPTDLRELGDEDVAHILSENLMTQGAGGTPQTASRELAGTDRIRFRQRNGSSRGGASNAVAATPGSS